MDLSTAESTIRTYYAAINELDFDAVETILDMDVDTNRAIVEARRAYAEIGLSYQEADLQVSIVSSERNKATAQTIYMETICVKGQHTDPYETGATLQLEKRGGRWYIVSWQ